MSAFEWLSLSAGWIAAGLIGILGLVIIRLILKGQIDLNNLISESDGTASMSRFQFLIFTFVISLSLLVLTVKEMDFPKVPAEVLALLGISGGSYVLSKAIQKGAGPGAPTSGEDEGPPPPGP